MYAVTFHEVSQTRQQIFLYRASQLLLPMVANNALTLVTLLKWSAVKCGLTHNECRKA